MKVSDEKIEEIKNSVPIEDVIGDYVELTRKGDRYWGRCPFHQEKTPSFTVTPDKGFYYCFGCQQGGNIFKFLMEIEGYSFIDSLEHVAKKGGIQLSYSDKGESNLRKSKVELNNRVAGSFHYILCEKQEAAHARKYLKERGIDREQIDMFRIGWAPVSGNWLRQFLSSKGYSKDFLKDSGLFSKNKGYPLFTGRIMFPIHSLHGDVIGFGGRTMKREGAPKYINSPESDIFKKGNNLFGLHLALPAMRKEKRAVLVEGYTDVIALHSAGISGAVAPLGTALTEKQAELLSRHADEILIMFDGDDAGINATIKAIGLFENLGVETFVINVEKNEDPAQILQQKGVHSLKNLLNYPINSFEYIMDVTFSKYPAHTPSGTEAACRDIFSFINIAESEIRREEYLKRLSEKAGIDVQSVVNDYNNARKGVENRENIYNNGKKSRKLSTDLYLMIAAAIHVDYFSQIRNSIESKEFEDPEAKELFIVLEENFRLGTLTTDAVINSIENQDIKNSIVESVSQGEFSGNIDSIIGDSIRQIKRRGLLRKQKHIIEQIRRAEKGEFDRNLQELLEEKIFIDDELTKLRVEGNV